MFCTTCSQFGHVCRKEEKGPQNNGKGKKQVAYQGVNEGKSMVQKWIGKGIKIPGNKAEIEGKDIPEETQKQESTTNLIMSTPRVVDQACSSHTPPEGVGSMTYVELFLHDLQKSIKALL